MEMALDGLRRGMRAWVSDMAAAGEWRRAQCWNAGSVSVWGTVAGRAVRSPAYPQPVSGDGGASAGGALT